jgi:hypothetical protein
MKQGERQKMQSTYKTIVENLGYAPAAISGIPEHDIEAWEKRNGEGLPGPLREYLIEVGNMAFNRAYNRLYPLDELSIEDGKLIFMEENQNVVQWAIDTADISEDPLVFQRSSEEDDELWYPEDLECTAFLELMIYWQTVNGGFEFFAMADASESAIKKIAKAWERRAEGSGVTCFARKGAVLCIVEGDGDDNLMLAAASGALLEKAMMDLQRLGVSAFNVP